MEYIMQVDKWSSATATVGIWTRQMCHNYVQFDLVCGLLGNTLQ